MGGNLPVLDNYSEITLINGLKNHPALLILFAVSEDIIVGMAVCFQGFSTFQAAGLLNIHDLIVYKRYRNRGIGSSLLEYVCEEARRRNFCRVTLEVRNDNNPAKRLYRATGFKPCENPMEFWINPLA
jgi:ribosomal protein S18 acetylase RimI-like enzyme